MLKHFRKFMLLALLGASFALRGETVTAARWIWYPESLKESEGQKRYFVKAVELTAAPKEGTLNFAADDACLVWINGKYFGNTGMKTLRIPATALKAGRNLIAVRVGNVSGAAGVLARGEILLADGQKAVIVSDSSWKVSRSEVKGWTAPSFAPAGNDWVDAEDLRGADADFIWREKINRADFMSKEEELEGGSKPLNLVPGATGGKNRAR